jgi:hypothetical protein
MNIEDQASNGKECTWDCITCTPFPCQYHPDEEGQSQEHNQERPIISHQLKIKELIYQIQAACDNKDKTHQKLPIKY